MISWDRELETASSASEVVHLTRQFLASLSVEEVARLPETSRPGRLEEANDIRDWRRRLTDEYWGRRGSGADVGVIQEVWSFLLRASIQLDRIAEDSAAALPR